MILRLTDGSTTINLTGGSDGVYGGAEYVPRAPDVSEIEFTASALRDGGELVKATRRNVAESLSLVITGASRSALATTQHDIEKLFEQARQYQERGVGDRVYVEYRKADSGDVYRSEILRGTVQPSDETASERWFEAGAIRVTVAWKRRWYWEGPESELSLENTHGSGTGGVTVYNHYDSVNENFVDIAGEDVEGVIPAACRIEMTNSYNETARLSRVWLAHNIFSSPASFDHILEGEEASGGATGSSSEASDGEFTTVTWSGDTETELLSWSLSTTLLNAAAGNWFHVLVRFQLSPATDIWYRFKIIHSSTATVWEGPWVKFDSDYVLKIRSMGLVQLPPWLTGGYDSVSLDLNLYGKKEGGDTEYIDFIQLTPVDGFRYLYPAGYGVQYNQRLVDDGIEGLLYMDSGNGTARYGYYIAQGAPIQLWPGRDQRLYFLQHAWTGNTAEIDRTLSVRVYYRPRRLTL